MKKILLILVSFICIAPGYSQTLGDHLCSVSKRMSFNSLNERFSDYPGDSTIDVTYYKLDLNITTSPDFLSGRATIQLTSETSILNSFFLDFEDNMVVDSITVGNNPLTFSQSNDKLFITLNTPVTSGNSLTIDIKYHGIPKSTGIGSFVFGQNQGTSAIWTLSEPYGAKTWFPNKDNPSDKADSSDVWITVASNLTGVSNGILEVEIDNGNGTKTYKWKSRYPIAPYLISLAIAEYSTHTNYYHYTPQDSMLIIDYIYPQNLSKVLPLLDEMPQMMAVMSGFFSQYPFINEKYGHAEFGVLAGMEHQTISSMGAFFTDIIIHELTHQWFGDKVTCAKWEDIWVNEGFAVYGEALYRQAVFSQDDYATYIKSIMARAKNAQGTIYVQDINNEDEIFNADRTYAKGGVVVHMLRGVLGDNVFFQTLKAYMNDPRYAYGSATIDDFKNVAESVSGTDLDYFFNEWIYGENYPRYNVDWSHNQISGNAYNVSVRITQTQNTFPAFFTMPITMRINTADGDTLLNVFNNQIDQTFVITINSEPISLDFDPDNWIMDDVTGNIFILPAAYELTQNYPNPFNPRTTINYELGNVSNVKLYIYDTLGREITLLVNEKQREGRYSVEFNGDGLATGVYFYKIVAENTTVGSNQIFTQIKKMVLLK
jgi:aminopeptidase N